MMTFERFERSSERLADFVYRQIFDAVVAGKIPPGERLVQEILAEEMDVSRTPVREALLRLESEGILESSERGGFLVRSVDLEEAREIYELRAAVEGYAARIVAQRRDPAAIELIRKAVEAAAQGAGSVEEGYELNRLVHRSIVKATGHALFLDTVDSIWGRSQAFRMFAELHDAKLHFLEAEPTHEEVLAAIESGDGLAAQEALVAHILSGLDLQLEVLEDAMARAEIAED
ncbi:MAG: GntR family transcriptional regulator [Acidimicrobiia bacterium]